MTSALGNTETAKRHAGLGGQKWKVTDSETVAVSVTSLLL